MVENSTSIITLKRFFSQNEFSPLALTVISSECTTKNKEMKHKIAFIFLLLIINNK